MALNKYTVIATDDVEDDLDRYVSYLLYVKKNEQAARNIIDDYNDTIDRLESIAGIINPDEDPRCAALGYRRMNFLRHNYFLLFRMDGDTAIIDRMFHQKEDYRNKIN